jgi:hypothetical protein
MARLPARLTVNSRTQSTPTRPQLLSLAGPSRNEVIMAAAQRAGAGLRSVVEAARIEPARGFPTSQRGYTASATRLPQQACSSSLRSHTVGSASALVITSS